MPHEPRIEYYAWLVAIRYTNILLVQTKVKQLLTLSAISKATCATMASGLISSIAIRQADRMASCPLQGYAIRHSHALPGHVHRPADREHYQTRGAGRPDPYWRA